MPKLPAIASAGVDWPSSIGRPPLEARPRFGTSEDGGKYRRAARAQWLTGPRRRSTSAPRFWRWAGSRAARRGWKGAVAAYRAALEVFVAARADCYMNICRNNRDTAEALLTERRR